jgi:hypothetical protein
MGTSSRLGVSSLALSDEQLNYLADHKTKEDEILFQILHILKRDPLSGCSPSALLYGMQQNEEILNHLSNAMHCSVSEISQQILTKRLDRMLVSSLAAHLDCGMNSLETGTFSGFTSLCILYGMFQAGNNGGLLFSIDLPTSDKVTQVHHIKISEIGSCVPENMSNRLILTIEDAKVAMPRLLKEYPIGLFVHDSLNTITHQMYEYILARTFMPKGAYICSDDILWNSAFVTFVQMFELPFWVCDSNPNYGIALNIPHPSEQNYAWGPIDLVSYLAK